MTNADCHQFKKNAKKPVVSVSHLTANDIKCINFVLVIQTLRLAKNEDFAYFNCISPFIHEIPFNFEGEDVPTTTPDTPETTPDNNGMFLTNIG